MLNLVVDKVFGFLGKFRMGLGFRIPDVAGSAKSVLVIACTQGPSTSSKEQTEVDRFELSRLFEVLGFEHHLR